jgi:hypothetical protein
MTVIDGCNLIDNKLNFDKRDRWMLGVGICMLVSTPRLDSLTRISHQLEGRMLEEVSLKFDSHNINSKICNIVQVCRGGIP